MILDSGIVTIFRGRDVALAGEMPRRAYERIGVGWYGETSMETSPAHPTEGRQELRTDAKIRILQNRAIRQNDVAVLRDLESFEARDPADEVYRITRAYHGTDDDGPAEITDLSLEVTRP